MAVGATTLVAAGVVEGERSGTFNATFPVATVTLPDKTGRTSDAQTSTEPFTIPDENVTRLLVRVRWTDDETQVSGQDSFTVRVEGPDGTRQESTAATSPIELAVDLASVPAPIQGAEATSRGEAEAAVAQRAPPNRSATGQWNVFIRVATGMASQADSGNGWTLSVTYDSYRAQIEDPVTETQAPTGFIVGAAVTVIGLGVLYAAFLRPRGIPGWERAGQKSLPERKAKGRFRPPRREW